MTPTSLRRPLRLLAAAALLAAPLAALAACGDDDETTPADDSPGAGVGEAEITLDGAWARTSPAMATAGAVYVQITNDGDADDALVGVDVDAAVAAKAELHETSEAEDATDDDGEGEGSGSTMGDDQGGGMMQMVPVDEIPVPSGETVALEPGGYHIMLLGLVEPLEDGATVEVVLTFEVAGQLVLEAEVRDTAP